MRLPRARMGPTLSLSLFVPYTKVSNMSMSAKVSEWRKRRRTTCCPHNPSCPHNQINKRIPRVLTRTKDREWLSGIGGRCLRPSCLRPSCLGACTIRLPNTHTLPSHSYPTFTLISMLKIARRRIEEEYTYVYLCIPIPQAVIVLDVWMCS